MHRSASKVRIQAAAIVGDPRRYGPIAVSLLTPVALMGYGMALWRLGADLNWLSDFIISKGLLSRWQVWFALGALTQAAAHQLNRPRRRDDTVTP